MTLAPGEVLLDHATRTFDVRAERGRTLKEVFVRGGRRGAEVSVRALQDVSVRVAPGEAVGLVGRNGAGKTSTLSCLAGIVPLDSGTAACGGRVVTLLELGAGFGADFSGRENIFLNGSILGMSKKEITRKFDEIVDFSGVEQFIDQPVKNYSSGMYVRLGFAIAINVDPDILVVDEVLAVGDAEFQDKCFKKFRDFKQAGKTVILVSHSMATVRSMCDHAAWLNHGTLMAQGDAATTISAYEKSIPGGSA